ncbi:sigma factor, partial [Marinobacter sp.]|uniref:sigma factor n=2 Tax=Marinobacter sp. TaxID=50741 RepID=UPI003F9DFA5E
MAGRTLFDAGFSGLYQEHHAWLVRWIARRTVSSDSAQDLAHDTFMRLLDRPSVPGSILKPSSLSDLTKQYRHEIIGA